MKMTLKLGSTTQHYQQLHILERACEGLRNKGIKKTSTR